MSHTHTHTHTEYCKLTTVITPPAQACQGQNQLTLVTLNEKK